MLGIETSTCKTVFETIFTSFAISLGIESAIPCWDETADDDVAEDGGADEDDEEEEEEPSDPSCIERKYLVAA